VWVDEDEEAPALTEPTETPDKMVVGTGPVVPCFALIRSDVWVEKVRAFC